MNNNCCINTLQTVLAQINREYAKHKKDKNLYSGMDRCVSIILQMIQKEEQAMDEWYEQQAKEIEENDTRK